MSLALTQTFTAVAPRISSSFLAVGGNSPYTYEVLPGGAGGSINSSTGLYTAPNQFNSDPSKAYDTIRVTDATSATTTSKILVGSPLLLFCDVLQHELGLANGRVYLWDQKIFQPTDDGLYIAVSVLSCKAFGNDIKADPTLGWSNPIQSINMLATLDVDIISRGPDARDRKEEVVLAFNSLYAQSQQEANSFYIGKLPPGARFVNLSEIDGAAIPYRFKISVNLQYMVVKQKSTSDYYDTFQTVSVATNP